MKDKKQNNSVSLHAIKVEMVSPAVDNKLVKTESIDNTSEAVQQNPNQPKEINGPRGLEPTRYGDWESKGRCYDF